MANETHVAFERLIFALQEFNAVAISAHDPEDPSVISAADALADAYTLYDDAIYTQYGVDTPLDTYDDFDDDHDDDDLDDDFDDDDDDEDDFADDEYDDDFDDDDDDEDDFDD
ncbi:hypothetical protein J2S70_000108 [Trueperella bonasi]|uniref:DNA primase n=1 Tax=Trueperella bonasi TaxID=312286 RepID=A0ABT9NDR6_9ACTO|nr:hypothetical protein [Trueperella bonasi]MDP9805526.1 hypothetical protein [Trueperella bonasi]